MKKIICMKAARKAAEQRDYKKRVLKTYEDLNHKDAREAKELAAEVHRKARSQF